MIVARCVDGPLRSVYCLLDDVIRALSLPSVVKVSALKPFERNPRRISEDSPQSRERM